MRRAVLIAVVVWLWAVPVAQGASRVVSVPYGESAESEALYQSWVDTSWMPTPDVEITVLSRACSRREVYACAWPARIRPLEGCRGVPEDAQECWGGFAIELPTFNRRLFAHELGHVFDMAEVSDSERQRIAKLVGATVWDFRNAASIGGERFADLYSGCMLGGRKKAWFEVTRKLWTRAVFRRGCRLIRAAGA